MVVVRVVDLVPVVHVVDDAWKRFVIKFEVFLVMIYMDLHLSTSQVVAVMTKIRFIYCSITIIHT